jgi:hypothetical protein
MRIRDPESFWPWTPGSGMEKFASGIWNEHLRSFWKQLKISNPRSGFQDGNIRIRDKAPGSTTLVYLRLTRFVCAGGREGPCALPAAAPGIPRHSWGDHCQGQGTINNSVKPRVSDPYSFDTDSDTIRIHYFRLNTDPEIEKNLQLKKKLIFFEKKLRISFPLASIKDVQVTKEAFSS